MGTEPIQNKRDSAKKWKQNQFKIKEIEGRSGNRSSHLQSNMKSGIQMHQIGFAGVGIG